MQKRDKFIVLINKQVYTIYNTNHHNDDDSMIIIVIINGFGSHVDLLWLCEWFLQL